MLWPLTLGLVWAAACASGSGAPNGSGNDEEPTPVGITVQNVDRPYAVEGQTAGALLAGMRERGPMSGGRRYFGALSWTLRYRWRTCSVHGVEVVIQTVTTMPRWHDADSAAPGLRAEWASFTAALRAHEEGHRRIALEAAIAIKRRLEDLGVGDCSAFPQEADRAYRRLVAVYNARDLEYDTSTRHGFTQGAVWPPRPPAPAGP